MQAISELTHARRPKKEIQKLGEKNAFPSAASAVRPSRSHAHSSFLLWLQPAGACAEELSAVRTCPGRRRANRDRSWTGGLSHAVRRHSDPGVRPGAPGRPRHHRGHSATQLEGEHQCLVQHHDPHLADAGAVDGLRLVQLWRLQLHHEELGVVAAGVSADHTGRHGSVLHGGVVWTLPCLPGA